MMVDRLPVAGESPRAAHQRARGVGGAARFAGCEAFGRARGAVPAARQERHDDALPDRQIGTAGAHLLDHSGGLVSEQHRHRAHPIAVDHRQIGVTQPGGFDADQEFALTRRRQIQLADGQRFRLGVGAGEPDLLEDRSTDLPFHDDQPARIARMQP